MVLAFTGAPADFPVSEENVKLQKYLVWSDYIQQQVDNFISKNILEVPYLGIHLRHGSDWVMHLKYYKITTKSSQICYLVYQQQFFYNKFC